MTRENRIIRLSLVILFLMSSFASASEIVLKSGKKIEGKIVERTNKYIKIDTGVDVPTTYYSDEVNTIDGKRVSSSTDDDKASLKASNEIIDRAERYAQQGKYPEAYAQFNKAIEINPKNDRAYDSRGLAYYKQTNYSQAILDYTKAIEINPNYSKFYDDRGYSYIKQNDLTEAMYDLNRAIKIDPKDTLAYHDRASAYFLLKDYDKAWSDVHKQEALGRKINPKFLEALKKASGKDN